MTSKVDVTHQRAGTRLRGKPSIDNGSVGARFATNDAFLIVDALQHLGNPDIKHNFTVGQCMRMSDLADALTERMSS